MNLTDTLTLIIGEIVSTVPLFRHIDLNRCAVCLSSNRSGSRGGTFGKLVPLRFEGGSRVIRYRGCYYRMPGVNLEERELLYLIYFYMPRFFDAEPKEMIKIIFHELFHISPEFNGDIRRMGEKKAAHGHSKKHYDSLYEREVDPFHKWIMHTSYYKFLALNSRQLADQFTLKGLRIKVPRPDPVPAREAARLAP